MNCKQFNSISLEEVLLSLGHLPTKQNEKEAWYLNPFASESQASFKIDKRQNVWYLYSEGVGGNNTDFMMKFLKTSVKEVLEWAEKQNFSSFHQHNGVQFPNQELKPSYEIKEIKELENETLKNYLQQRGLSLIVYPLVKEIHFRIGDKQLYAIGFKNRSEGWELRNPFYKGGILKKDVSIVNFNNETKIKDNIVVFEGFIDALSFVEMQKSFKGDLLVMNSIALLGRTKEHLKDYSNINLFLDNDKAGLRCKNEILKTFPEAKDYSGIYENNKDLNDYLVERIKIKIENQDQKKKREEDQENQSTPIYRRKR